VARNSRYRAEVSFEAYERDAGVAAESVHVGARREVQLDGSPTSHGVLVLLVVANAEPESLEQRRCLRDVTCR
jgi:hypothetical protein